MKFLSDHWTLEYVVARLGVLWYQRRCPEAPWLTKWTVEFLSSFLQPHDIGLEFGSGRSTLWLARRIAHLTSVESESSWFERISGRLTQEGISNVDYLFLPTDDSPSSGEGSEYVAIVKQFPEESLDFVLVDGRHREDCALQSLDRIVPGGILILDNSNWFVPSASRAPDSRSFEQGPLTSQWGLFIDRVSEWRCFWSCNGVWSTSIYLKPCRKAQ